MKIKEFILVKTCSACPEQYDVFKDGNQVGYLRLRHGYFTCDYPNVSGEEIYSATPNGDGMFESDEREYYLVNAIIAIENKLNSET